MLLSQMTGRIKRPRWLSSEEYAKIGLSGGAVSISQAVMVCKDCEYQWRQCEVNTGYGSISSECPRCGGKCAPGSEIIHTWAPVDTLIVWSELPA